MGIDDNDIGTGASLERVMAGSVVVGCVASGVRELDGDEGGLIGRAGGGWRLVAVEARTTEGARLEWGGLRLLLVGGQAVWHVMVDGCRCRSRG